MSTEDLSKESKEPEIICAVCSRFEPQAWRKKFCKNCFHSLDEHTGDGEKESGHEIVENEKNLTKADPIKHNEEISKDKLSKDDKNKSNKPSTDKPLPEKDIKTPKNDDKTSAIVDKFNKKGTGSGASGKFEASKPTSVKPEEKGSVTDKLKGKFDKKTNEKTTDKKSDDKTDNRKLEKADDKSKSKLDNDKTRLWGGKSKFETKSNETKNEKTNEVNESEKKGSDDKAKLDNEKTKSWGAKSKFEPKPPDVKDEKKDEKLQKEKEGENKTGIKIFKPPERPDNKLKWKNTWGSTLSNQKTETDEKETKGGSEKETKDELKEKTSAKDSIKSKFESKNTGNLWGASSKQKDDPKTTEKVENQVKNEERKDSKFGEAKSKLKDISTDITSKAKDNITSETSKPEEPRKTSDSKTDLDNKTKLWGSKSKFDSNKSDNLDNTKTNKSFGVNLKKSVKSSEEKPKETKIVDQKSETENKKNEKIEGKLKLDIKKAETANKFSKDSNSVSHSAADRLKEKYEKLSKTPTSNTPSKPADNKVYSRSKSDTAVDIKPEKQTTVTTPEVKTSSSYDKQDYKLSLKTASDNKTESKAKSPSIKPTHDQGDEFSDTNDEVKDAETSQSKEPLPKLNTDEIRKIKDAAKFLLEDDLDDGRYNSLGRKKKSALSQQATSSLDSSANLQADDIVPSAESGSQNKASLISNTTKGRNDVENVFNEKFNSETEKLRKQLKQMEEKCSVLEEENKNLKNGLLENEKHSGRLMKQKQDVENSIKVLQKSLTAIESKCSRLETENANLVERIKVAQSKCDGNSTADLKAAHMEELRHLQERLGEGENIVDELREHNENLKQEILDLKNEMEEMYDTFRDQEAEEFRDVQREMEMHAKNCRVLSFKLRKYERLNDQLEAEKENYEEKITNLQNQISDGDTRAHVRDIEDELRLAKEVSVRLHDELDILEEKKCKVEDENHQLTQILEQSDKKQFRLEMEVDKLRDQIAEFKKKIAEKSTPGTPATPDDMKDRRTLMGRIGQQGSQEQDISQLTRDLYDSMERETDLKDQLKFAEEEIKDLRRKRDELEEENENLSVQLKKMSASKVTKYKESKESDDPDYTEAEIELKVHLELNEQELMVARRKIQELEHENENLLEQSKILRADLAQKEQQLSIPQPPLSPNIYYEDKIKELNFEADELKWKIIEKDREIEKLSAEVSLVHTRQSKMRKSRSLEADVIAERKKHLDLDLSDNIDYRDKTISETHAACSPDHLQYRKQLPISSEGKEYLHQDNYLSPIDENVPIQTQFYSRSKPRESLNVLSLINSSEYAVQLENLKDTVNSLQQRIKTIEAENAQLKEECVKAEAEEVEGETREELMEKILDMEEDADILNTSLKKKDAEIKTLQAKVTSLQQALENKETELRRKELELLRDLDIAQEKNDVLSNLLDIVKERADNAEAELERIAAESRSSSVTSENSARTVSTLSDVSFGSDEVFADGASRESSAPGSPESIARREKRSIIHKDWEGQFRKRVHCLERILAEERQKLAATEKKLALVSTETLSTAMSDDAKLHEREKEILYNDLQETKKHLRIASDQITGLKERILTLEEENNRLKNTFWNNQPDSDDEDRTPSGSIDTVLSVGSAERIAEQAIDSDGTADTDEVTKKNMDDDDHVAGASKDDHVAEKKEEMEFFRQRVASLEARLEESNDIWKSKSSATEKEKENLEEELRKMTDLCDHLREASQGFQLREEKALKLNKEYCNTIKEKQEVIARKDDIIQEHEDIIKHREDDLQQMLDQISQRDRSIRELRESIRSRDERLKEKDEILQNLSLGKDEKQEEINFLTSEMSDSESAIKEKDEKIQKLEEQLTEYESKSNESNIQLENDRLKGELEDMAFSIGKVHTDNNTLQNEMEKTKQALSEAMVLWNKDRSTLGQELNVAREKLALFEGSVGKKESQAAQLLRKEAHKYLEQKEKLQHDLRICKVEHDAHMRTLKNEKLKLQDELTQTIRQLTTEMSNNDKMSADLERLKNQEEVAFQIQHHEKVLRAEYMAMKVRFETRLENLQKEHTKLLTILDQMQHEKVLNQEIIKGVQKQMANMKESYNRNLENLKRQNETLERHMKELEGARDLAMDLQIKVDELKRQIEDQEYERAEIVDKITAERSAWELERSNKQSKINQLEEKLAMINNAQSRTKDMQSRMEVAWNRERAEQKRLLEEAHNLAIDLQKQLKSRDEEHLQEKRVLLDQLKVLRKQLDDEQILHREQLSKQGTRDEQLCDLEKKLKDMQDKAEKEHDMSLKDQADLVRRLGEMRRQHKRDQRMMEDVLSGLTRLRELASLVVASENNGEISDNELEHRLESLETGESPGAAASEETQTNTEDIRKRINEVVLKYIKEALKEIYFAAENIARPREVSDEERKQLRRSLSSSELDALKEDFVVETLNSKELEFLKQKYGSGTQETKYQRSVSGSNVKDKTDEFLPGIHMGSFADRKQNIMSNVHNEQGLKIKFPDPPPSFLLPRCIPPTSTTFSTSQTVTTYKKETTTSTSVKQIPKSISIDTCLLKSYKMSPQDGSQSSVSHSPLSFDSAQCSFQQILAPIPVTHVMPPKHPLSASVEIVTPRTARKHFFEDSSPVNTTHKPWPTRSRSHESVSKRDKETIVSEIIVPETTDLDSMKLSNDPTDESLTSMSDNDDQYPSEIEDKTSCLKESKSEKKKQRKAAKRSVSLDSTSVKNNLAKAGVSVMSPAAPSALSPSEIFAAVKRKFKPNIKRSSSLSEKELHSVVQVKGLKPSDASKNISKSQEMRNTFEPPRSGLPPKSILIPPATPPISAMQRKILPVIGDEGVKTKRSRDDKKDKTKKRPRSKSAERARTGPSSLEQPIVHQDIIPHSKFLGFETSV